MSEPLITDEDVLRFTQKKRKAFLDHVLLKGFPDDKDGQHTLLATLADMDRAALGNKRIGAVEKLAGSERMVAQAITDVVKHFGAVNPFEGNGNPVEIDITPNATLLPSANTVPGETSIGIETGDFNDFVKEFED